MKIVPFYDRTKLINETLETLNTSLFDEILVTVIVIIIMLMHLRSSMIISATLPLTVLICFVAMKLFGVAANIVALSGIAIAIGTIVDMGTVVCENILTRLRSAPSGKNTLETVYEATSEVGGAVLTAILTTVVGFLPVFTMIGAEGKLFRPLAFTKTFTLLASVLVALFILPAIAHILFTLKSPDFVLKLKERFRSFSFTGKPFGRWFRIGLNVAVVWCVAYLLTKHWLPLGLGAGFIKNFLTVLAPIALLLGFFLFYQRVYSRLLMFCLRHKSTFLALPLCVVCAGPIIWLGFNPIFQWVPSAIKTTPVYVAMNHAFPGLGKEFMPPLDEGSFLYMPTTMPHASIGEVMDVMRKQDMAFAAIPEVESAVGKLGHADTALDPAPISMIETMINYKSEYLS
ncbi:MAG: efflux RND transporter permease subunit, partial [Victivallales bacterium]|nr:efflux RND transporter permease subunit [Victivallales bacterium]